MARPTGSGRGLTVTGTVRLTPSEARALRSHFGSLPKALRAALTHLYNANPGLRTAASSAPTPRARLRAEAPPPPPRVAPRKDRNPS